MDRIEAFWDALGALTYAEMIEVAAQVRDAFDCAGTNTANATDVASALSQARSAYLDQEDE